MSVSGMAAASTIESESQEEATSSWLVMAQPLLYSMQLFFIGIGTVMILLVGGEKGSGKSCLAQNLAVYLRTQFHGEVLLVDCDPQRTTSDWIQERNDNPDLPQINCVQLYGNIRNDLLSLKNRYDYLIVDCGGQDNRALRSTMAVATHALIPLRPKRRDLKTLPHMEDLITTCKMVNPSLRAPWC